MDLDQMVAVLSRYDDVLVLRPTGGDDFPEIAWGDAFFYFSPDGQVPPGQPFATVVTKDYPHEPAWRTRAGDLRVNLHVGTAASADLLGHAPGGGERAGTDRRRRGDGPPDLRRAGLDLRGQSGANQPCGHRTAPGRLPEGTTTARAPAPLNPRSASSL